MLESCLKPISFINYMHVEYQLLIALSKSEIHHNKMVPPHGRKALCVALWSIEKLVHAFVCFFC